MATFSQFKSKYITERRSKNIGDEGTKNIVKKLLGKEAIPDDGGKAGQGRIEKELGLNKNNTTTNRRGRRVVKKTYTPPDKVTSKNIQTKSIVNQANKVKDKLRTVDKTTKSNVVKGSGDGVTGSKGNTTVKPNTNTVTNTKKTSNIKGQIDQALKDYQSKLKNQVNKPKVNVNQTPKTNVSLPDFTKQKTSFSGRIGNVTNITKNRGPQIPNFKKTPPVRDLSTKREIKRIFDRDRLNRGLKNIDTADLDKQKLSKRAFQDFKKDAGLSQFKTKVLSKAPVKKALKVLGPAAAVAGSALDFRNTYKQSQAQGDTKRRSLGKGLSRVAGGLVGGALGAAGGSAIAPGAGTAIGGYGGYVAGQELGGKVFDTLTTSKGRKQIAKSFTNFRNKAMKPVGK